MRKRIELNDNWMFYLETLESRPDSVYTVYNYTELNNAIAVDLPHDWSIEQPFTTDYSAKTETASLPGGIGWYTKKLPANILKACANKCVSLSFGGVYMRAYVYINNIEVASNFYGYNSFDIDISEYFLSEQDITVTVKVINQLPNSRWYSGSGIYRKVCLNITESVHIDTNGIYITTPNLKNEHSLFVSVHAENNITNRAEKLQKVAVLNTVLALDGSAVSETVSLTKEIKSNQTQKLILTPVVKSPKLWSTEFPALYTLRTEVFTDGKMTDCRDTVFGFRWFDYDKKKGFLLNGKPLKLQGVCLHHDQGALGAKAYTEAIQRQLEIMQGMGVNAVRTSHNPASGELIQLCDRMGILVIEESFDTWAGNKNEHDFAVLFNKKLSGTNLKLHGADDFSWSEFIVKSMIRRDRNAASVFLWSLGNEVVGEISEDVSKMLSAYAEQLDPYNLSGRKKIFAEDDIRTGVDESWAKVIHGFSAHDNDQNSVSVAGVNYVDEGTFESAHIEYPDILLVSTESSSALRSRGVYSHPFEIANSYNADEKVTENSQMSSYDNDVASWANSAMLEWKYDISLDYVLGEFVWTGFDYLGEPTPFTYGGNSYYPTSSYFGITDTAGFPKDIYYFYQSQWRTADEQPVLHLLPDWDITDSELKDGNALVVAYTNASAVELRAKNRESDVSLGARRFTVKQSSSSLRSYKVNSDTNAVYSMALEWTVPYEQFKDYILYAVPLAENGKIDPRFSENTSGRTILRKSCAPSEIKLASYKYKNKLNISDDGYRICYVSVAVNDKNKTCLSDYHERISFEIFGYGAQIIGVDNGNASDTDKYKFADKSGINAFGGKALVIVKVKNGKTATLNVRTSGIENSIVL